MKEADALVGLRGLACLHIMLHHLSSGSYLRVFFFHGPLEMPLFYLLSGYSLALGYGSTSSINIKSYLRNRFARVAPLYYFSLVFGIPVYMYFKSLPRTDKVWMFILTATCTNSWVFPGWFDITSFIPFPYNRLAWTISTLFLFYLLFPAAVRRLQKLDDRGLARAIVLLNMLQFLPFIYPWMTMLPLIEQDGMFIPNRLYDKIKWLIIANPFPRFPVFLMGVTAGLQTIRSRTKPDFEDPNESESFVHDIFPTGLNYRKGQEKASLEGRKSIWRRRVDRNAALILLLMVGISCLCYSRHLCFSGH